LIHGSLVHTMTQLVLSYVKMCMLKIIIFLSPCSCLHYKNPTVSTGTYIIAASDVQLGWLCANGCDCWDLCIIAMYYEDLHLFFEFLQSKQQVFKYLSQFGQGC